MILICKLQLHQKNYGTGNSVPWPGAGVGAHRGGDVALAEYTAGEQEL
jgi:hypothetical protein